MSLAVAATAVSGNPWILGALREYLVNYADMMQTDMDEDFPATKVPYQVQILFLGDLGTMGWGVEYQNTFSFRGQKLLQSAGPSVRALNTGIEGYTALQERYILEYSANSHPQLDYTPHS